MKHIRFNFFYTLVVIAAAGFAFACSHNPNKAEKIDTNLEKKDAVTNSEDVGVDKDGDMVWQKKVLINEELRRLQFEVYEIEDRVYGSRKFNSTGLYGAIKECETKLAQKQNGGNGALMWTEPLDRVTDKEEVWNVGVDEKARLVGVSQEFLKDRIARFQEYKRILQKKEDEFDDKLTVCQGELKSRGHAKAGDVGDSHDE